MYLTLVTIHILTAIIGIGHTFLMPFIYQFPKTVPQIVYTEQLMSKLGTLAKVSDFLLFTTGMFMIVNVYQSGIPMWLLVSLILFGCMRFSSGVLSAKPFKAMREKVGQLEVEHQQNISVEGEQRLLNDYRRTVKKMIPSLLLTQTLNLMIILLMIWKP